MQGLFHRPPLGAGALDVHLTFSADRSVIDQLTKHRYHSHCIAGMVITPAPAQSGRQLIIVNRRRTTP